MGATATTTTTTTPPPLVLPASIATMTLALDDTDEYESLPSGSVITHMIAGAIAGTAEHCVMYPLDSVKVIDEIMDHLHLVHFILSWLYRGHIGDGGGDNCPVPSLQGTPATQHISHIVTTRNRKPV